MDDASPGSEFEDVSRGRGEDGGCGKRHIDDVDNDWPMLLIMGKRTRGYKERIKEDREDCRGR